MVSHSDPLANADHKDQERSRAVGPGGLSVYPSSSTHRHTPCLRHMDHLVPAGAFGENIVTKKVWTLTLTYAEGWMKTKDLETP